MLDPARSGANTLRLRLSDPAGAPRDAREVEVTAQLPAERIGPVRVPMDRLAPGSYRSEALRLPRAGDWTVTVRVRTGEFDAAAATTTLTVR